MLKRLKFPFPFQFFLTRYGASGGAGTLRKAQTRWLENGGATPPIGMPFGAYFTVPVHRKYRIGESMTKAKRMQIATGNGVVDAINARLAQLD